MKTEAKIVAFIALWFAIALFSGEIIYSFLYAIIIGIIGLFGKKAYQNYKKKQYAKLFEKDFAFALMSLSTQLSIGISFENSLQNITLSDYGIVSKEFVIVLNEIKQTNSSIQSALLSLTERINSQTVRRGISQIISAYDKGRKEAASDIKAIALELLTEQKNEAKAFSSKVIVLSLMFIAVSAIIFIIWKWQF